VKAQALRETIAKHPKTRVLIVDDDPLVREGLARLLDRQNDLACCGQAASSEAARLAVQTLRPEVVLLDLCLGAEDGLELLKSLKRKFPKLRLLVVSSMDETLYAGVVLRAGGLGYVMKNQSQEEVLKAIRLVMSGQMYASARVTTMAIHRLIAEEQVIHKLSLNSLSPRELEVFRSLAEGRTNLQTAEHLHLRVKTVETYCEHIKYKLGVQRGKRLAQLAEDWLREQLATLPSAVAPALPSQASTKSSAL
jgi:DNA-binding NarL/FixJ family response regulator